MNGERACSNPLCSHFWRMVPEGLDHFCWALKQEAPILRDLRKDLATSTESLVRRLGRVVYKWVIDPKDYDSINRDCCAKIVWFHSFEKDRDELTEWYYFCDDCNEVLEKASA